MPSVPRRVKCDTFNLNFISIKEAASFFGVRIHSIARICNEDQLCTLEGVTFTWIDF